MKYLKWFIKRLKLILTISIIFIVLFIGLFFIREFISNYFVKLNLEELQAPNSNSRVLIFSPHNDDETLGSATLIAKTIKNGGKVKIVLITNGDGFKSAIQLDYYRFHIEPSKYIEFGYERQKESINALKMLNVSDKDIIFLGYPDGGISLLWYSNWDKKNPYTSNFTKRNRSPYSNSYTKNVLYTGQNLSSDIIKIVNEFKPTHIVMPHPNDKHPDHWAVNAFVKYSLAVINYSPVREWLYLVHRGDWPTPLKKSTHMFLVPPNKLVNTGTNWYSVTMQNDEIITKTNAIHSYKTQLKTLGLLMSAFERRNELFGEYPNLKITKYLRHDNEIIPDINNKVITDPLQDTLSLKINKNIDLVGVNCEISKDNNLHFFIEADANIDLSSKYFLSLISINGDKTIRANLEIRSNKLITDDISNIDNIDTKKIKINTRNKIIHIIIPCNVLGDFKHIFINATTFIEENLMDKTAWRMLDY